MQVGLLWFDNDPHRGLTAKIEDAACRYREKFGRPPDTCYVNSLIFGKGSQTLASPGPSSQPLRVVPAANILPHHFWVGEEVERNAET
jgi:hypothetical protein